MPPFAWQGISGPFTMPSNILWKLEETVIRGRATDRLPDTYQSEREPHHDAMTNRAVTCGRIITSNRAVTNVRDKALRTVTRVPGFKAAIVRR
jgi:3-(3-hydroxy-phenyl)propionate hydroxylase